MTATHDLVAADLEAEEHVLGACMLARQAVIDVAEILTTHDFYRESHRHIYDAILELDDANQAIDPITVRDHLDELGILDRAGGPARLVELVALCPSTTNVQHYARIVREMRTLRDLRRAGDELTRMSRERGAPAQQLVEKAERIIFEVSAQVTAGDLERVSESIGETVRRMTQPAGDLVGVPSGLRDLDRLTAGFQKGNLIIVGARPSMGKSALVLGMIDHVSVDHERPVGLFSLEMTKDEVNQRLISRRSLVDLQRMRRGTLGPDELARVYDAAAKISQSPLYLDDDASPTLASIRSRARRLKAKNPDLALIVVDYLQLMTTEGSHENRTTEVSAISRGLKAVARELDVPVVALSQLSRGVESRIDKRPLLSDLRESGSIEQDADLVVFLYRDDYYHRDSEKAGIAELIVAKHRNGPTDMVEVGWRKATARFADLA